MKNPIAKISKAFLILTLLMVSSVGAEAPFRDFIFAYKTSIKDIPRDVHRLNVWVPYPLDETYQIVEESRVEGDYEYTIESDPKYGNKLIHYNIDVATGEEVELSFTYKVRRYEFSRKTANGEDAFRDDPPEELEKYLLASEYVTLSPRIKEMAASITEGLSDDLRKARAIYDYVVDQVDYDKSEPGWGKGDTERVCDIRKGNCTDFHSLFISLTRANNIPARFIIGFPLPKGGGKVKGYHCWAEFYIKGTGWMPVDASEAKKDPSRREYLFGMLDENRVEFTRGRDLVLTPEQEGGVLNYFIYPHVEADGKPFDNIDSSFEVREV